MANRVLKIFFIIGIVLSFQAKAQIYNNPFLDLSPTYKTWLPSANYLQVGSNYSLGSNALNAPFFANVLGSASLVDDNTKNGVLPYLKSNNDFGAYLHNYVFYTWQSKKSDVHYYVNLASRIQYTAQFSADAYKLILFGNDMFAGGSANVSGFNFSNYAYQSLQFGLFKYRPLKSGAIITYGGGLSVVSGAGYWNLSIPRGSFFTSAGGDSLSLDAKVNSKSVSPLDLVTDVNGIGLSLNGFVGYWFSGTDHIMLQVEDLGAVNWFKNTSQFSFDKKISYTGEKVSAMNGNLTFTKYYLTLDSIATQNGYASSGGSFTTLLPFQLRLLYTHYFDNNYAMTAGTEYIHDNMRVPAIYLSATKSIQAFSFRLGLSAFGYSSYGVTAGADVRLTNTLKLSLGTEHLEGLAPLPFAHGQSYFINIKWGKFDHHSVD